MQNGWTDRDAVWCWLTHVGTKNHVWDGFEIPLREWEIFGFSGPPKSIGSLCCGVRSKRDHSVFNTNGTICDAVFGRISYFEHLLINNGDWRVVYSDDLPLLIKRRWTSWTLYRIHVCERYTVAVRDYSHRVHCYCCILLTDSKPFCLADTREVRAHHRASLSVRFLLSFVVMFCYFY